MGKITVKFDWKNNQEAIKQELAKVSKDMTFAFIQTLYALVMERIFNKTKDANGKKFGKYKSSSYKRKREKFGRQITNKDLQFTGTLMKSIKVGKIDANTFGIGILATKEKETDSASISRFQEEQLKTAIFTPSAKEIELAEKKVTKAYMKKISNILTK